MKSEEKIRFLNSVTKLGDFLHFGMSKSIIFQVKSFLGNFYKHLDIFFWSHCLSMKNRFQLENKNGAKAYTIKSLVLFERGRGFTISKGTFEWKSDPTFTKTLKKLFSIVVVGGQRFRPRRNRKKQFQVSFGHFIKN